MKPIVLISQVIRTTAEIALRRDANRTSCAGIYQPKAPANLNRFKRPKE